MAVHFDLVPIDLAGLSPLVRDGTSRETPTERRLLLARAVFPLAPEDLLSTLAILTHDPSELVSQSARESLNGLPWGVLGGAIQSSRDPGVLDAAARELGGVEGVWDLILANPSTSDDTFGWVASRGRGPVLDQVAASQVRHQRCPRILEALYYNPETRMGTISDALENAVRLGIDLSHIPGYQEIVESLLGREAATRVGKAPAAPVPVPEAPVPPADDTAAALEKALADAGLGAGPGAPETGTDLGGLDDDSFYFMLQAATWEEGDDSEPTDEETRQNAQAKISSMSVSQKVRMALMGNEFVRSVLIRDTRRVVYMSVLKSPRTSDKEVITWAQNRSLNDDIVRAICANRDWTKLYPVKLALVQNPKTPPTLSLQYLRSLTARDLKNVSGSRDVPGYVMRQAKSLVSAREQPGGKKH
jgi:hypothetical protein